MQTSLEQHLPRLTGSLSCNGRDFVIGKGRQFMKATGREQGNMVEWIELQPKSPRGGCVWNTNQDIPAFVKHPMQFAKQFNAAI